MTGLAETRTKEGEDFLKGVVADRASPDRKLAASLLAKHHPNNYQYFVKLTNDPDVRIIALSYLVEHGSDRDLPLFIGIIERGEEEVEIIIAYQAVAKWGNEKIEDYIKALSSNNEVLVRGGLTSFCSLYDHEISLQLGRLARHAREHRTRMLAGVRLAELGQAEAVPHLVILLGETYRQEQSPTFNAIASVLTMGIWMVFDGLIQSFDRKSFGNSCKAILAGLRRITRADAGSEYENWKDWAILHGYVIRGENIVQQLFFSNPQKRTAASEAGAKLLGFRCFADYLAKKKISEPGLESSMMLARELAEKGFMPEEKEW